MTAEEITAAIEAGDLDGHLAEIVTAARVRMLGQQTQRWRITHGDLVVTEEDLTLAEAVAAESLTGAGWGDLSPVDSAAHTFAVLAAALNHRTGMDLKAAAVSVGGLTVEDAVAMIDFYEAAT